MDKAGRNCAQNARQTGTKTATSCLPCSVKQYNRRVVELKASSDHTPTHVKYPGVNITRSFWPNIFESPNLSNKDGCKYDRACSNDHTRISLLCLVNCFESISINSDLKKNLKRITDLLALRTYFLNIWRKCTPKYWQMGSWHVELACRKTWAL